MGQKELSEREELREMTGDEYIKKSPRGRVKASAGDKREGP